LKTLFAIFTENDTIAIEKLLPVIPRNSEVMAVGVRPDHTLLDRFPPQVRSIAGWRHSLNEFQQIEESGVQELLDRFAVSVKGLFPSVEKRVERGDPARRLISIAREEAVNLLVLVRQENGPSTAFGHVASRLVRHAPCCVLLLDPAHPVPEVSMLLTDGSAPAKYAAMRLNSLLANGDFEVIVCSVVPTLVTEFLGKGTTIHADFDRLRNEVEAYQHAASEELVNQESARFRRPDVHVSGLVKTGDKIPTILQAIEETGADLLAVGSKGLTDQSRFLLGSVTLQLLDRTTCSILVGR
jgi:nucleotide-binding universal stress UspA family protein